jgi:hypothetical protein
MPNNRGRWLPFPHTRVRFILPLAALLGMHRPSEGTRATCAPPDSLDVPRLTRYLTSLVQSNAPVYKDVRDSLHLPRTLKPNVHLERGTSRCQNGVDALNRVLKTPGQQRQIWVFSLGVGYAIRDPGIPHIPGQDEPTFIFDRSWRYKGELMEQ